MYGKVKLYSKTLEGTIAFFLSSTLIVLFFSRIELLPGMIAVIIATLVESSDFLNIDDNLSVPLSFSISYSTKIIALLKIPIPITSMSEPNSLFIIEDFNRIPILFPRKFPY